MRKIIEEELSDYEGKNFLFYQSCNGQAVVEMVHQTREMFAKNDLSIAEAKGFLDYMKLIIEFNLCASDIQENNKNPKDDVFIEEQKKAEAGEEKNTEKETYKQDADGGVFTNAQRRLFGLKCIHKDESLIYEILKILGDKELSVDRVSRVLADTQSMLPILAKLPTK